jgi:hypothetical protein
MVKIMRCKFIVFITFLDNLTFKGGIDRNFGRCR